MGPSMCGHSTALPHLLGIVSPPRTAHGSEHAERQGPGTGPLRVNMGSLATELFPGGQRSGSCFQNHSLCLVFRGVNENLAMLS